MYVPLDVNFPDDPRIMDVGLIGAGVYVHALCIAKRLGLDGELNRSHLTRIGADPDTIDALIRSGLLTDSGRTLRIDGWLKHNPSTAELKIPGWLNHKRWHVDRNIVKEGCEHCEKTKVQVDPDVSDPDSATIRSGLRSGIQDDSDSDSEEEEDSEEEDEVVVVSPTGQDAAKPLPDDDDWISKLVTARTIRTKGHDIDRPAWRNAIAAAIPRSEALRLRDEGCTPDQAERMLDGEGPDRNDGGFIIDTRKHPVGLTVGSTPATKSANPALLAEREPRCHECNGSKTALSAAGDSIPCPTCSPVAPLRLAQ